MHPPLQLRLTAPEESGFRLEKVPVHSMKEVWGVLEVCLTCSPLPCMMTYFKVVREQCWLNEILNTCQWVVEGLKDNADESLKESEATEEELQAVLSGQCFRQRPHLYRPRDRRLWMFPCLQRYPMPLDEIHTSSQWRLDPMGYLLRNLSQISSVVCQLFDVYFGQTTEPVSEKRSQNDK